MDAKIEISAPIYPRGKKLGKWHELTSRKAIDLGWPQKGQNISANYGRHFATPIHVHITSTNDEVRRLQASKQYETQILLDMALEVRSQVIGHGRYDLVMSREKYKIDERSGTESFVMIEWSSDRQSFYSSLFYSILLTILVIRVILGNPQGFVLTSAYVGDGKDPSCSSLLRLPFLVQANQNTQSIRHFYLSNLLETSTHESDRAVRHCIVRPRCATRQNPCCATPTPTRRSELPTSTWHSSRSSVSPRSLYWSPPPGQRTAFPRPSTRRSPAVPNGQRSHTVTVRLASATVPTR